MFPPTADTGSVSGCSNAFTVPLESFNDSPLSSSQKLSKSQHSINHEARYFSTKNHLLPVVPSDIVTFKTELLRLRGAIYFGFGAIQLAFSFLPSHLKVINFLGYEGDEHVAINCLLQAKNSTDFRSVLAVIALLWYYLVLVPFFSLEHSDLSKEIQTATEILNENEQLDQSALFLYFSGRRQRLKKKIHYAVMHYDAAIRQKTIPRELKIHVMYELGVCLLIQLNYHDAMHYFNELKWVT
jgi:tetratricopeptide (TPR) repeat protein